MRRWLPLLALAVLLVPACSGSDDERSSTSGGASAADGGAAGGAASGSAGVAAVPAGAALTGARSIISTATATVSVDDVEVAARRAVDVAVAAGGFLARQEARLDERRVHLTLRVPSARFQEVLGEVGDLGELAQADVRTEDVTEEVVDLESRIASARASVERLRDLLGQAGDVAQLAAVEGELARREADLESLLGRLRVLEDQVDLSTIAVDLTEEPAATGDDVPGFVDALGAGWVALVGVGRVGLAGIGYALPFAVLALPVAAGVAAIRARSGRDGRSTAGDAPPTD